MIGYFPTPQKDELLSSLLARFSKVYDVTYHKEAQEILFGTRKVTYSPLFQGHIEQLLSNVDHIWHIETEQIIKKHTILPLFKPFIAKDDYQYILSNTIKGNASRVPAKIGKLGSTLNWPEHFKICPICIKEQFERLGYCYWQRLFQCLGVEACPKHHCMLYETKEKLTSHFKYQFVTPRAYKDLDFQIIQADENLINLARLTAQLFEINVTAIEYLQWTHYYRNLAELKGFTNYNGLLYPELISEITSYWGKEQLITWGLLNPQKDMLSSMYWLKNLFLDHKNPCLYQKHLIVLLAMHKKINNLQSIIDEVQALPAYKKKPAKFKKVTTYTRDKRRKEWLALRKQYPNEPVKFFKQNTQTRSLFDSLIRSDRDWYEKHKPKPLTEYQNNYRVDWKKRDREIAKKLLAIYYKYAEQLDAPWLSKHWYCSQFKTNIFINLDKLPLCRSFFIKYAETTEQYQCRRLTHKFIELMQDGRHRRSIYEIAMDAGISKNTIKLLASRLLVAELPKWQE